MKRVSKYNVYPVQKSKSAQSIAFSRVLPEQLKKQEKLGIVSM
jgi:hypothetical protein